jgi:hypothetical protein
MPTARRGHVLPQFARSRKDGETSGNSPNDSPNEPPKGASENSPGLERRWVARLRNLGTGGVACPTARRGHGTRRGSLRQLVPSRSRLSPSPVRFGWERVGVRANDSGRFPVKQRVPSQRQSKAPRSKVQSQVCEPLNSRPWTLDSLNQSRAGSTLTGGTLVGGSTPLISIVRDPSRRDHFWRTRRDNLSRRAGDLFLPLCEKRIPTRSRQPANPQPGVVSQSHPKTVTRIKKPQ